MYVSYFQGVYINHPFYSEKSIIAHTDLPISTHSGYQSVSMVTQICCHGYKLPLLISLQRRELHGGWWWRNKGEEEEVIWSVRRDKAALPHSEALPAAKLRPHATPTSPRPPTPVLPPPNDDGGSPLPDEIRCSSSLTPPQVRSPLTLNQPRTQMCPLTP